MKTKKLVIIGATSTIAAKTAQRFAIDGAHLFLVARNQERLSIIADDLRVRGATVTTYVLDVNDSDRHTVMLEKAQQALGEIDAFLIAHGTLPSEDVCAHDPSIAASEFTTNATSTILLLIRCAEILERQKRGSLAVITSVAGDRGRKKIALYAAAKAAVNVYLQGLRQRLSPLGIRVLTLKPGFVDTPMTVHLPKNRLFTSPEDLSKSIFRLMNSKADGTYYLPGYWRFIMVAVRLIPDFIMKRLNF